MGNPAPSGSWMLEAGAALRADGVDRREHAVEEVGGGTAHIGVLSEEVGQIDGMAVLTERGLARPAISWALLALSYAVPVPAHTCRLPNGFAVTQPGTRAAPRGADAPGTSVTSPFPTAIGAARRYRGACGPRSTPAAALPARLAAARRRLPHLPRFPGALKGHRESGRMDLILVASGSDPRLATQNVDRRPPGDRVQPQGLIVRAGSIVAAACHALTKLSGRSRAPAPIAQHAHGYR